MYIIFNAFSVGYGDIVEELLAAGASVNATNDLGFSPLFYAAQYNHIHICKVLIDKGADPSIAGAAIDEPELFLCPVDHVVDSPELMKLFTDATVSSMSQNSPGFAMASNMMKEQQANTPRGQPPPPPVETKTQGPLPGRGLQYTERPSNSRPDIAASRGAMFREESVDMGNNFASANDGPRSVPMTRPEMRGPQNTDLDNILAGLKTRTVDIHAPAAVATEEDSMISISSLMDTQNGNLPKRSNRRKQRSDKNVVALDI